VQSLQSSSCPAQSASTWIYGSNNQVTGVIAPGGTQPSPSPLTYDQAGNVQSDAVAGNQYLYDGEGRICAVSSPSGLSGYAMTGYIYDADGARVAKGRISTWSCDPAVNGFQTTNDYILGPGGEQVTEMAMDANNTMAWQHTNVYAGGSLIATYDNDGLHFYFNDPLGTRRAQTNYAGVLEQTCSSLPFGDGLSCSGGNLNAPTEHHFTGKERDAESGNDYFEARYYSSAMGRFMSPDWSAKEEPVPYAKLDDPQSLNLYAYVQNNPLIRFDKDGHDLVILNDPKGAILGQGHNASIVGNDKDGWTYFSKALGNNKELPFKTFGDFQKSDVSTRYSNADRFSTTTKQDAAMKDAGEKDLNKPYSLTAVKNPDGTNKSGNCADNTATISNAGGVAISTPQTTVTILVPAPFIGSVPVTSSPFTSPNQQYADTVKKNNGTQVQAHCTGSNCSK
jgi:RHS repeat-associated protein